MGTVAEYIHGVVTAGQLPSGTWCGLDGDLGRVEIEVPGTVRAWVEPFVAVFSSDRAVSMRYPGLEAELPEGPPFVVDRDPMSVWHFRWSILDTDDEILHTGWEMKLGWFPGQRTASKLGVMLAQTKDGAPVLRLAWNGDNATIPAEWWQTTSPLSR